MNFNELSQIIRYLKKTLPCANCTNGYKGESIEVLSTFDDQGLFSLKCPKCQNQLLVHITISDEERNMSEPKSKGTQLIRAHRAIADKDIEAQTLDGTNISTDDVINMHFFLNQFNGDFKKLFSKQK
jgi:transcription initiation factor IIE alpha subunit